MRKLSEKEYRADLTYQATMSIVKKLFTDGLITETEYAEFDTKMQAKYRPIFGTLFSEYPLTSTISDGNM